ncbi:chemotaxis protein CheD [Calorimonas adulescens]|jgi:CheD.|uniref:Probable chemoreceptor glutamine deamidase CheD n=1 Tax=Calorimonas adulescens TaxID=2606906 RepID=A0A5D8QGI0_9THEO|nr:chemotaxis protein CheD [Calorimonas adulescens]TZE83329.1 chemotaxis protein CheD [Calorimonas adulescens]
MESKLVRVGMADMKIAYPPDKLVTVGLGSCVGVIIYDMNHEFAGMVHIMLPKSKENMAGQNIYKFADTGIYALYNNLIKIGAQKNKLLSKIAGGAQMFTLKSNNDVLKIGRRNVDAVKCILNELNIPIISEDVGGNYGRTIEFDIEHGTLNVKTIGFGEKSI